MKKNTMVLRFSYNVLLVNLSAENYGFNPDFYHNA